MWRRSRWNTRRGAGFDAGAGVIENGAGALPRRVNRRGVSDNGERLDEGLPHGRRHGRGRSVVEVDGHGGLPPARVRIVMRRGQIGARPPHSLSK